MRRDDEQAMPVFEPEVILPEQFFGPRRDRRQGEHRLMAAILDDAVLTCCVPQVARARGGYRAVRDAGEWIDSDDRSWMFSFERICDALDLNAEYIRRGVRALKQRSRRANAVVIDFPRALPDGAEVPTSPPVRRAVGGRHLAVGP